MNPSHMPEETGAKCGRVAFQGTRWSVVIRARDKDSRVAQTALSELCGTYWYPLYAFVRRNGYKHHEAQDLTQGFFEHLISKDGFAHVDPKKGKFRSFLLSSMNHFLSNERERAQALKRGGGNTIVSIDADDGESRYACEPADETTPQTVYERCWAITLLTAVLADLRLEYRNKGKQDVFDMLQGFVVESSPDNSYARAAEAIGTTEGNVKVLVFRLRRRFGELLRERIGHTVESELEIDEELRHLMTCFSR